MSIARDIWGGWMAVTVQVLRGLTGRRRPDYQRIRTLEIEVEKLAKLSSQ